MVGAQWLMGDLGGGPLQIALIQTATTLPVFVLVLPAGALGDILDRRRLLLAGQSLMLTGAALLAVLSAAGRVNPSSLLALIALMGVGQGLSVPSFQAIQPELVPRDELPHAALLNGVNANVARALGPAIGGALVAALGPEATFGINAVSFLGVLWVLYRWDRPTDVRPLGPEHVTDAIRAGARYVRSAPAFGSVLARSALFMAFAGALWALLPAVARGPLQLGAGGYGLLLTAAGVGAIAGAFTVPALRARLGPARLTLVATLAYAAGMAVVGLGRSAWAAGAALLVVGLAWIAVQSTLNATAQMLLPSWTRARALAYWQLTFMGGQAGGAALWGAVAAHAGLRAGLVVPAVGLLVSSTLGHRLVPVPARGLDVQDARLWEDPVVGHDPGPEDGPVLVTVEWRVDPARAHEFVDAMRPVARARKRTGATLWGLFQDIADPELFLETFTVATWHEHLRQHFERGTAMDAALEARARSMLRDGAPPRVRHLIWAEAPLTGAAASAADPGLSA
jgi:MFS family permease